MIPDAGLPKSAHPMAGVAFSGDGRFIAASWHSYDDDRVRHLIYRTASLAVVDRLHGMVIESLSHSGRYLAVSGKPDGHRWNGVYRYDRHTGAPTLASVALNGRPPNGPSSLFDISADGRTIAFNSGASNLVPGDIRVDFDHGNRDAFDAFVATVRPCRGWVCTS